MSDLGEVPKAEGVTIKINDESLNNLLPPKADSQLAGADFLPQQFFRRCHLTPQFFGAFEFCLGDYLICNNILDRHVWILIQNLSPALS